MDQEYEGAPPDSPSFIYSIEPAPHEEASDFARHKHRMMQRGFPKKLTYILLSFVFSIGINMYNTYLFNKQHYNLGLPIFAAALYEVTQLSLAAFLVMIIEWRSGPGVIGSFRLLPSRYFLRFILPCGFAAGLNVALSNCSLQYISLSFYTMVKSCAPIFVLIFAFILGLETPNATLFGIIALMGVGIVLTVWGAFSFNLLGFALVFGAAIISGLRWTLTQLIIESKIKNEDPDEAADEDELSSSGPLNTMLFLSPVIGGCLLILSGIFEGPRTILASVFFSSPSSSAISFGVCLFGGLQSFTLMLLEYKVVQETSVLTFSVSGIVKELLIIGLSVWLFGDRIQAINMMGASITIVGLCFYNLYKIKGHKAGRGLSCDGSRRKRLAGTTIKNVFVSLPTSEPPGWMVGEMNATDGSTETDEHSWFYAPRPSPTCRQSRSGRHSEMASPVKDVRCALASLVGGSLKSTRASSPVPIHKSVLAFDPIDSPIELSKV